MTGPPYTDVGIPGARRLFLECHLIQFAQRVLPRRIMVPITRRHLAKLQRFMRAIDERRAELDRQGGRE